MPTNAMKKKFQFSSFQAMTLSLPILKYLLLHSTDLESKFPVIGSTIRRLTVPDSSARPSASNLLATTFCPHYTNGSNGCNGNNCNNVSTDEACPRPDDDALARLEDENRMLKEKIKLKDSQLSLQLEVIDQQRATIEMLEKMISSKIFGIN
jgi:hypothetical protein